MEEYTAHHSDTFAEVLKMDAEVFEAAWASYKMRSELERLEVDQRAMIAALYANSGIGGDDLTKAIEGVRDTFRGMRFDIIAAYKGEEEAENSEMDKSQEFITEKWW